MLPFYSLRVVYLKQAGKKLLLITNSDYHYTDKMMRHSFNRFLPNDMSWRDLFDIVSSCTLFLILFLKKFTKVLDIGGMKYPHHYFALN